MRLLGALLGQVIAEQGGSQLLALVEETQYHALLLADIMLDDLDAEGWERLAHAFALYFQLVNLAEEKHRLRQLRRRQRAGPATLLPESVAEAVAAVARSDPAGIDARLAALRLSPVLTAHPTEARRRTLLVALRRVYGLLDRLDDPRLTPGEDAELRRRLREELTILWRTSSLRSGRPSPLDEVRSAMVFFDDVTDTNDPQSAGRVASR